MICIVEDNESIRETVRAYLELAGYSVTEHSRIEGVLESFAFKKPQLCVLDIMLPDGSGFSLAKRIREKYPDVLFLFLSAREAESDRITGLELGAEDYIVKPFSPRELVLRVQAVLRRSALSSGGGRLSGSADDSGGAFSAGAKIEKWQSADQILEINHDAHEVYCCGQRVHLTAVEWNILTWLTANDGVLVTRERILGECLDYAHDGSDRTVNTHIKNIRLKLQGEWIETVRAFGYKFIGKKI